MLKRDLGNRPGKLYGFQYVITDLGVRFNDTEFDFSDRTGLVENFSGIQILPIS